MICYFIFFNIAISGNLVKFYSYINKLQVVDPIHNLFENTLA